ncbi:hypothetical protein CP533_6601 [Ophiocordyceps camponoti-saundersi (nom. inval.)]|nr:hypothetical protein CP533_6601 [Ophiocordyceps camponoti-saundersi (nom. inval.)]
MPDRSVTVVSYAAGASLAAVALIYVFGPTFTIDNDGSRKKTIVGLRNNANDCFINSVLQALAGLGDLRTYLIRETHRRHIDDVAVYQNLVQPEDGVKLEGWKLQGLQMGIVTQGLKEMLDALNERPIAKKSVTPFPFVKVLEAAFKQRISRQQQDAQEFLQIVAERLKDEYRAGQRARARGRSRGILPDARATDDESTSQDESLNEGFPMEGKYESRLVCQTCHYKTKPREEGFCTITLAVPHVQSTSLNACFDGIFKTEFIDDFKCEMCRLLQAKTNLEHELSQSTSPDFRARAKDGIEKLRAAIDTDPEQPPEDVDLGDMRYAPKRRISKTTRMTIFPKILAVHLSRSIYGVGQMTQKNSAKVAFPERLPLGGLSEPHQYKLLGIITHRGGHNSGHYEAFRRQSQSFPYPNANTFQPSEVYSKSSTPVSTPQMKARQAAGGSPAASTTDLLSSSSPSSSLEQQQQPRSVPAETTSAETPARDLNGDGGSLRSVAASTKSALSKLKQQGQDRSLKTTPSRKAKRRKPTSDKWWRVSDEKVREAKTAEVLGMQREVLAPAAVMATLALAVWIATLAPFDSRLRLAVQFHASRLADDMRGRTWAGRDGWLRSPARHPDLDSRRHVGFLVKTGYGTRHRVREQLDALAGLMGSEGRDFIVVGDWTTVNETDSSRIGVPVYDVVRSVVEKVEKHPRLEKYTKLQQAVAAGDEEEAMRLGRQHGWELDALKFISGLEMAYRRMPDKKWYMILDDDTYLVRSSLELLLSHLDPWRALYLGNVVGDYKGRFAHGGSAVVLSAETLRRLFGRADVVSRAYAESLDETWGDRLVATTLHKVGIYVEERYAHHFSGETPSAARIRGDRLCSPIVSFHGLRRPGAMARVGRGLGEAKEPVVWAQLWSLFAQHPMERYGRAPYLSGDHVGGGGGGGGGGDGEEAMLLTWSAVGDEDGCRARCERVGAGCLAWTFEPRSGECRGSPWATIGDEGVEATGVSGINWGSMEPLARRCLV